MAQKDGRNMSHWYMQQGEVFKENIINNIAT
jgi:hypothetical protein